MRVSAEGFWLVNFAIDYLTLFTASRGTWFFRSTRLLLASALGAFYALFDARLLFPLWADGLALLAVLLAAFPARDPGMFAKTAFLAACMALCTGAFMRACLVRGGGTLFSGAMGALAGAGAGILLKRQTVRARIRTDVRVRAEAMGVCAEFTALVDTGNLLTEPFSALPVLIADEIALGRAFFRAGQQNLRARRVAYGSVGGDGEMRCLRPDDMRVFNGRAWVRAPEMWLGLYPGRMNRGIHALAPGAITTAFKGERK